MNRKDGKLISSTSIPNEERNDDEFGDNDSVEGEDVEDHDIENEEHIEIFCRNEKFDYNDISTKRALAYSVVDAIKSGDRPSYTLVALHLIFLVGSVIRNNLELYKWACRMIEFDNELQSCYLFHRLSRTSPHSIPFRDVILLIYFLLFTLK